jgi:hypothetical protein
MQSLPHAETECQWSINNFWLCIMGNLGGDWLQPFISKVLGAFHGKNDSIRLPDPS